jgi:hypothetical protein
MMNDWLHNLPTLWMALLVFGFTYLVTAAIYAVVALFAVGERARSFKAVSPGLLSPLGVIFGLFVALTAAQVWADNEKARAEIDREASARCTFDPPPTVMPTLVLDSLNTLAPGVIKGAVGGIVTDPVTLALPDTRRLHSASNTSWSPAEGRTYWPFLKARSGSMPMGLSESRRKPQPA